MFLDSSGNCKTALKEGRSLPPWGTPSLLAADVLPPDCFDKWGENMAFWGYMLAEGFLGLRETHSFAKEGFFFHKDQFGFQQALPREGEEIRRGKSQPLGWGEFLVWSLLMPLLQHFSY